VNAMYTSPARSVKQIKNVDGVPWRRNVYWVIEMVQSTRVAISIITITVPVRNAHTMHHAQYWFILD